MRFPSILSFVSFAGIASKLASAHPGHSINALKPRRVDSILNNITAQPDLPTAGQATAAAAAASLNLSDIQGDILIGMRKKIELFFFFSIADARTLKSKFSNISSHITTAHELLNVSTQPITAVNLAFSQIGLTTLGVTESLGDGDFENGQFQDADALGDPGTKNWVSAFTDDSIEGVFLFASDTVDKVNAELANIQSILGSSITEIYRLQGGVRPGADAGHEHFGYMDGISQPAVKGFTTTPAPGQTVVDPGHFLLGESGDSVPRPAWAKDGSFMAFRQLQQLVPEFAKFLTDNPISEPGVLTREQGSALLGARMVGRWKSGAPVDLAPLFDDSDLAADPKRNNNFTFAFPGEDIRSNQTRCPFSAHIRKTNPRADFTPENTVNHIIRAGIPYGPEVTDDEHASNSTTMERGLAFVAYQSNLGDGFRFLQQSWANNPNFMFGKNDSTPGADPIVGALGGKPRKVSGLDPTDSKRDITLVKDFVVSRGGEYFFSPPLSAIVGRLAT